jgi:beta-xylosidase
MRKWISFFFPVIFLVSCQQTQQMNFEQRIQSPTKDQIFDMEGYFVWGGSVIQDESNVYHMFATRWPKKYTFACWLTHADVVHATSKNPEGPYQFKEPMSMLKEQDWCANSIVNPNVFEFNGTYYLAYTGINWAGLDGVEAATSGDRSRLQPIRYTQRIGLASAPSPDGPWKPLDSNPILHPRPDKWDSTFTTNPSFFITPENKVMLMYKSTTGRRKPLQLGLATADHPAGPYERIGKEPLFDHDIEDPYVWMQNGQYWMVAKDMRGDIIDIRGGGILYTSDNGVDWRVAENPLAYDMKIRWADGATETVPRLEKPQLLVQDGKAICIYHAVRVEGGENSYNLARLLK